MRHLSSLISSSACAASVALFSVSAAAHIELVQPTPRYELPSNKSCPCGDGDSNRRCDDTAETSTDPNRSTNVTTFEAGATITVVAEEYIDHAGRMRVAFDPEGADLADFNDNVLMDVADPSDSSISPTNPLAWEFQIQLPTTPCENCTLQVIQAMHGDTENPVLDPAPLSTYYSCADIRIVPRGTLEAGEGGGSGGTASVGAAGAAGAAGSTATGGAAGAGGTGGSTAAAGTGAGNPPVDDASDDEADDSGCALTPAGSSRSAAWALGLLGLLALRQLPRRRHA
jgi:MYXO-CTERM domain-containing protein